MKNFKALIISCLFFFYFFSNVFAQSDSAFIQNIDTSWRRNFNYDRSLKLIKAPVDRMEKVKLITETQNAIDYFLRKIPTPGTDYRWSIYDDLKETKKNLLGIINTSSLSKNQEIKYILDYIENASGSLLKDPNNVDSIFNRDLSNWKLKGGDERINGSIQFRLLVEVFKKLLSTEIEASILKALLDEIWYTEIGIYKKTLSWSESTNALGKDKIYEYGVFGGIFELSKEGIKNILTRTFENMYISYVTGEKNIDEEYFYLVAEMNGFTNNKNIYQYQLRLIKNNIERYPEELTKILPNYLIKTGLIKVDIFSEKNNQFLPYFDKKLFDIYCLWLLEKNGINRVAAPDYVKKKYSEISEYKLDDYFKDLLTNTFKRGEGHWIKSNTNFKFSNCLSNYIESVPRMVRPNFESEKISFYTYNLFDWTKNIEINLECKVIDDTIVLSYNDNYLLESQIESEYLELSKNESSLEYADLDKFRKLKQLLKSEDEQRMGILAYYENLLPMLFRTPVDFREFLLFYKAKRTKVQGAFFEVNDMNNSPIGRTDSLRKYFAFSNPSSKSLVSKFNTSKSEYIKVLTDYMSTKNVEYNNGLSYLGTTVYSMTTPILDKYKQRITTKSERFETVGAYFSSIYARSEKYELWNGSTSYSPRNSSSTYEGTSFLSWKTGNNLEVKLEVPVLGDPMVITIKGKIVKNTKPNNDNEKWPYIFVVDDAFGSNNNSLNAKNDEYYIRFTDSECSSTVRFAGVENTRTSGTFFSFEIIL